MTDTDARRSSAWSATASPVAASGHNLLRHGTKVAVFDPAAPSTPQGALKVGHAADLAVTDVVALCHPHPHAQLAAEYLAAGVSVVSMSDDLADVRTLVELDTVPAVAAPR